MTYNQDYAASKTLSEALKHTYETRWARQRDGGKCSMSQAEQAAQAVGFRVMIRMDCLSMGPGMVTVGEITVGDIREATAGWYAKGLSPATINKRLNCLSAMGVTAVKGTRQKIKPALKWWLRPEEEKRAVEYLRSRNWYHAPVAGPNGTIVSSGPLLADYIEWTTRTGLRVEESLRLTGADFGDSFREVTVPGLKTNDSQATLPLSEGALMIAQRRFRAYGYPVEASWLFPITYELLLAQWDHLKLRMGWEGNGVTLKALRRSAARYLHVDCGMPIDMVRTYLRHEDIETTLGYLRLTGGYGTEEMRRYLK